MQSIAILDAGSQYGKLIDRRIRELGCHTEILPIDTPLEQLVDFRGIIISGGPNSVHKNNSLKCDSRVFGLDTPILGICYGMQLLNQHYGGVVESLALREDGQTNIKIDSNSDLFSGLATDETVLLTHGDSVTKVADELKIIGTSGSLIAAIEHISHKQFGVQFHPEVDLTTNGKIMFTNFIKMCRIKCIFTIDNRIDTLKNSIKEQIKDRAVVVLVSGGVDSTVCAKFMLSVLPKGQVHTIHIDNGFMRLGESDSVKKALGDTFEESITVLDCKDEFFNGTTTIDGKRTDKLCNIFDPEIKRKIIGDTFIKIITAKINDLNLKDYYLVQGTLRPDLIESASAMASSNADKIKTHHNDTDLVRQKRDDGLILEPLKDYHKDEVREIGNKLGLPDSLVWRQPFPGPGLAIRVLCQDEPYKTGTFDELVDRLSKYNTDTIKTVLLPIQSVGVQGDGRTYSYVVGLTSPEPNWDDLFKLAKTIPQENHKVNRVVYIFGDHVDSYEYTVTPTNLTPDVVDTLRVADDIFNRSMFEYKNGYLVKSLSQVPIVLTPVDFGEKGSRSLVIRTFITRDFMTGVPAVPDKDIPLDFLFTTVNKMLKCTKGVSRVMYDLTSKPPGTTEWE